MKRVVLSMFLLLGYVFCQAQEIKPQQVTADDLLYAGTAGISWRGFDLGAGIIYDSFHQLGFTANLSWTYCFRIK